MTDGQTDGKKQNNNRRDGPTLIYRCGSRFRSRTNFARVSASSINCLIDIRQMPFMKAIYIHECHLPSSCVWMDGDRPNATQSRRSQLSHIRAHLRRTRLWQSRSLGRTFEGISHRHSCAHAKRRHSAPPLMQDIRCRCLATPLNHDGRCTWGCRWSLQTSVCRHEQIYPMMSDVVVITR